MAWYLFQKKPFLPSAVQYILLRKKGPPLSYLNLLFVLLKTVGTGGEKSYAPANHTGVNKIPKS